MEHLKRLGVGLLAMLILAGLVLGLAWLVNHFAKQLFLVVAAGVVYMLCYGIGSVLRAAFKDDD